LSVFNIVARRTLLNFCKIYPDASFALMEWYYEMIRQEFKSFNEMKRVYKSASLVGDDRVVFNIAGNKFRLVVRMIFEYKSIQIKWFGTHIEYDKINVKEIQFKKI
jgi:mRNA interferase HigB